jgi:hypothetical protein
MVLRSDIRPLFLSLSLSVCAQKRHFDNESSTWVFDCEHDAANSSTYEVHRLPPSVWRSGSAADLRILQGRGPSL